MKHVDEIIAGATVRRDVVVRIIKHFHDAGHPDYQDKHMMACLQENADKLCSSDEAQIPEGICDLLTSDDTDLAGEEAEEEQFGGVDKAAIPAERLCGVDNLKRDLKKIGRCSSWCSETRMQERV